MMPDGPENVPCWEPTWTSRSTIAGHRWWVVFDQAEGFQPAYALVQEATATDALDQASDLSDRRINDFDSDTTWVQRVSANWAEDVIDGLCDTCGGTGSWESTTEESPDILVSLGACPDCR